MGIIKQNTEELNIKCPINYDIYQGIIFGIKTDLVIEIETNKGDGALCIAGLEEIVGKGIVHTIDINNKEETIIKDHKCIKCFFYGYANYDLSINKNFEKIMIIENASHYYIDSLNWLKKIGIIIIKGSFYIVEDGIINKLKFRKAYNGWPLKVINEFLETSNQFINDIQWCGFYKSIATCNINGYLLKIK